VDEIKNEIEKHRRKTNAFFTESEKQIFQAE